MNEWDDFYFFKIFVIIYLFYICICYILYIKDLYYYLIVELLMNNFGIYFIILVKLKYLSV